MCVSGCCGFLGRVEMNGGLVLSVENMNNEEGLTVV